MFPIITDTTKPPAIGESTENLYADFKTAEDPRQREKAKDVAALSNALGGVIWIGVEEDGASRTVRSYRAMSVAEVDRIRTQYAQAVNTYCSPCPLVDTRPIAVPGGVVAAVTVFPFPGQAIGVRMSDDEPLTYSFPIRQGDQTGFLKAEQLPMLMVPEVRRIVILLRAIPKGAAVRVQGRSNSFSAPRMVEVRELENIVVLSFEKHRSQCIPLDRISSVWRSGPDRPEWCLRVVGDIMLGGNGAQLSD